MKGKSRPTKIEPKKVRFSENVNAYSCHEISMSNTFSEAGDNNSNRRPRHVDKASSSSDCSSISTSSVPAAQRDPLPETRDRVNQTYNKLKVKLKEVQMQLEQNPRAGRLKLTLFIIALYAKTIDLMKPFPKFLMKGSKPDITRCKLLMSNMPDLNLIQSYSRYEFYTNYLAIQFLYWLTVELTSPPMTQVTPESMLMVFQKINPITQILKPDIIMRVNLGNSRTMYNKKLVYIVANTNQIHRLLQYGPESLVEKPQGTICATNNALVNLKLIERPEQCQMECSDIDYITILIAEMTLDRTTEVFHGRLNVQDVNYLVSNPQLLALKYMLLYKLGTFDVYKKLMQHEKKRLGKEMMRVEENDLQKFLFMFTGFVLLTLALVAFMPS